MSNPQANETRLESYVKAALLWITQNQERFWAVTGVVLVTAVAGILVVRNRAQANEDAWNQLGTVQGQLMQGQFKEASKNLTDWETRFVGTSASSYEQFTKADLLMKTTDYAGAAKVYGDLSATAQPDVLRPIAMAAHVNAEQLMGNLAQAKALAQAFLEKYPDHYLAGSVLWTQAHLAEKSGDAQQAAALYERFTLLYPQNPWMDLLKKPAGAVGTPPTPSH